MSSESGFWKAVRAQLSPFGKLERIENRLGEGMGDVVYCLKRKPFMAAGSGFIELKECEWPKRATTTFHIPSYTKEQLDFAEGWASAGGRVHLFARVGKDYLLWPVKHMRPIFERQYTSAQAQAAASVRWRTPSPWPLAEILDQLAGYENVNK